ncbi:hypothetical protein EDF52_11369 [Curtobacterium sp. PhB42]|uniref:hypothetical protein n=1 Tax=unclassified Curtobacterium TaxID=257496 RepID=UPI00104D713E|nr:MULTISPECIES: hypothetical protein [unclassified Curtobacterium]TCU82272.1 hypothetical protein EDF48_11224 [Curtobacterium sp. PhB191]TDW43115.1 hypothetical protein EDF52_11369 [Curtobacterium sp. PhB42]TDW53587.1 hypothetical protein EDF47_10999 [Curtobacterium sp. PhB190]
MVRVVRPGGDEAEANERLNWQMQVLRSMVAHDDRTGTPDIARPGSELAGDDRVTAPFHTSHLVHYALGVASDALRTTLLLMDDGTDIRVPMIGLYPLLRTVIEGSALATWLVAPDDRLERVKRTLETRLSDLIHDDKAVIVAATIEPSDNAAELSDKSKTLRENARRVRAEKRRLREHAARVGVELDLSGRPGFGPLLQAIAPVIGMSIGEVRGVWHFVSGLTHPSLSRAISMADVELKQPNGDGTVTATMSANLATVNLAIDAALLGYKTALETVGRRGGRDDLAWTDASLPVPPNFRRVWNDR